MIYNTLRNIGRCAIISPFAGTILDNSGLYTVFIGIAFLYAADIVNHYKSKS